jgi:hypothetical protein
MNMTFFFGKLLFFSFCFTLSYAVVQASNLIRLDYLEAVEKNPPQCFVWKEKKPSSDRLFVSTNLSYVFTVPELDGATLPQLFDEASKKYKPKAIIHVPLWNIETTHPNIPDKSKNEFIKNISEDLCIKSWKHLVFDNIPWKQIIIDDISSCLSTLEILEFRQTIMDPNLLIALCPSLPNLKKLSFKSCFMHQDLLKNLVDALPKLEELFLLDVGFLRDSAVKKEIAPDCIPGNLKKLSILLCYKAIAMRRYSEEEPVFSISKTINPLRVNWFRRRTEKLPLLETLVFSEWEIPLDELASHPFDTVFELAPKLTSFVLEFPHYRYLYFGSDHLTIDSDYLTLNQSFKGRIYDTLAGITQICWEKNGTSPSLVLKIDELFDFTTESVKGTLKKRSFSKEESGFFRVQKRDLSELGKKEEALEHFECLIKRFPTVKSVKLDEGDSFTPTLKPFLEVQGKIVDLSSKQPPLPDNVFLNAAKRLALAYNVFNENENKGVAFYSSDLCEMLSVKHNLPEDDLKKRFEDGSINKLFKESCMNPLETAIALLKKSGIFLFELKELQKSVGPFFAFSSQLLFFEPVTHSELPLEFLEHFSVLELPRFCEHIIDDFRIRYAAENFSNLGVFRNVIEILFPAIWRMIPLPEVQERALDIAYKLLGEKEKSNEE